MSSDTPHLDDQVRAILHDSVPGVVVIIVGPEGVRARAEVGYSDLSMRLPMTSDTAIPWFSMTKLVTATVVACLAGQGMIDFDTPVAQFVPAIKTLRPAEWAAKITVRHLLQHSSGLANPIPIRWIHPADRAGPDLDALLTHLLIRNRRLRFEPGARSSYSNLSALILGSAVSNVSGERFEELVRREVLEPLKLASTDFSFLTNHAAAVGYHFRYSPMRFLLPGWAVGPAVGHWLSLRPFLVDGSPYGGLVGPAEDAARFARLHLCDGELEGVRLLSSEMAISMRHISSRGRTFDFGLGWFTPAGQKSGEPAFVEHLGGGAGFFNLMRLYMKQKVGVVIMGNATKYEVEDLAKLALDFA